MRGNSRVFAFEGIDGCGKSLQAENLYEKLQNIGLPSILVHEPGSTPLGERIGEVLKHNDDIAVDGLAELLLFNASRAQLLKERVLPGMESGKVVIIDRYVYSTLAYQGYGRGIDLEMVKTANDIGCYGVYPDLNILLDISPEKARKRLTGKRDRFESEDLAFHRKVRSGYLSIARSNPGHWLVVDGSGSVIDIAGLIWSRIEPLLNGVV